MEFKKELTAKITATAEAATSDPDYTTFLKHFGTFKVSKLDSKEVTENELILDQISELNNNINSLRRREAHLRHRAPREIDSKNYLRFTEAAREAIKSYIKSHHLTRKTEIRQLKDVICEEIIREVDPVLYFPNRNDYEDAFSALFDVMYG